jgi:hypothetical protein
VALTDLSPLGPGPDYVDFARAALQQTSRSFQNEHRRFSALPLGHLTGIRLDLMATGAAPHNKANLSLGSAQRHRRAGLGFSSAACAEGVGLPGND